MAPETMAQSTFDVRKLRAAQLFSTGGSKG